MLSYAFTALRQENFEEIAKEEFDNIHNLFAAILAKGIGLQLKQGLYREYLNRTEDLTVMRGKIEMPGTVRNKVAHKQVLTCEYDECIWRDKTATGAGLNGQRAENGGQVSLAA